MSDKNTSSKFGARSTAREVVSGHDLRGREAIVTGGASGIGIETVRALAEADARVVIATRDRSKGEGVAATLRKETGKDAIEFAMLDLGSLKSVRAFVAQILATGRPLHLLINNAGIMATPQAYTEEGFESQFGTNHIGHFALTVGLHPALKKAGKARVVELTSIGHRRSDVVFDDLNFRNRAYERWSAYGQSKTANALFAVEANRRWAGDGIVANSVHPGGIMSGLQKFVPREEQLAMGWIDEAGNVNPRFKSPEQGAATSMYAAVAPELEGNGGHYLEDCGIAKPWTAENPFAGVMPYALDVEHAKRLWDVSLEAIAKV